MWHYSSRRSFPVSGWKYYPTASLTVFLTQRYQIGEKNNEENETETTTLLQQTIVAARTPCHHRMFRYGEQQLWGRPLVCEGGKQGRKAASKHQTRSINSAAIMELHDCKCQLWSAVRLMSGVNQRELKGALGSQGPVSQCLVRD